MQFTATTSRPSCPRASTAQNSPPTSSRTTRSSGTSRSTPTTTPATARPSTTQRSCPSNPWTCSVRPHSPSLPALPAEQDRERVPHLARDQRQPQEEEHQRACRGREVLEGHRRLLRKHGGGQGAEACRGSGANAVRAEDFEGRARGGQRGEGSQRASETLISIA